MSFGRPYILNIDGCIHDGWLVISPASDTYVTEFLYYLLSSSFAYEQFADAASGGVVSNLNSNKVASSYFPLPPLSEQHRIVVKIEEIFERLNQIQESLEA
jgi:type I restriction enzyme S subunit